MIYVLDICSYDAVSGYGGAFVAKGKQALKKANPGANSKDNQKGDCQIQEIR